MKALLATILIGALVSPFCCCIAYGAGPSDQKTSHSCCDTDGASEQQNSHDCGCKYVVADIDQNHSIVLLLRDITGKEIVYFESHEANLPLHASSKSGCHQSDQRLLWKRYPLYLKHCVFRI